MTKRNFNKWIAFAFPYIAQLIYKLILFISSEVVKIPLSETDAQTVFLLLNSMSILFGIAVIRDYVHFENCANFKPNQRQKGIKNVS